MTATLLRQTTIDRASGTDTRPVALLPYLRISNDPEGKANGVDRQRELIERRIIDPTDNAMVLDWFCDNDTSASTLSTKPRPNFDRMLVMAREAATSGQYRGVVITAYSDSRVTRRPEENESLIKLTIQHGVTYRYVKSPVYDLNTADGRESARNAASRNAGEAERTGERVADQKQQAAMLGVWRGGRAPLGYRLVHDVDETGKRIPHLGQLENEGYLVLEQAEADLITDAIARVLAGETITSIARAWDACGVAPRRGGTWHITTVRKVLTCAVNAGLIERHGEIVGQAAWGSMITRNGIESWGSIVTRDELDAVRAVFANRGGKRYTRTGHRWLGSGGTYACHCGAPIRSGATSGRTGVDLEPRYRCSASGHLVILAAPVDAYVRGVVCTILARHGAALLAESNATERARLADEAAVIRARIDALSSAFAADDRMGMAAFMATTAKLGERLSAIDAEQAALVVPGTALAGVADAADPVRTFLDLPVQRQRAIVSALLTVTIHPGRRGGRRSKQWEADMLRERVKMTGRHGLE